jgi:hypothetical protein
MPSHVAWKLPLVAARLPVSAVPDVTAKPAKWHTSTTYVSARRCTSTEAGSKPRASKLAQTSSSTAAARVLQVATHCCRRQPQPTKEQHAVLSWRALTRQPHIATRAVVSMPQSYTEDKVKTEVQDHIVQRSGWCTASHLSSSLAVAAVAAQCSGVHPYLSVGDASHPRCSSSCATSRLPELHIRMHKHTAARL